jgi:biopolymer transport protein ExbB
MRVFKDRFFIFLTFGILLNLNPLYADSSVVGEATTSFDIIKVFQSCPVIYSLLIFLSLIAITVWVYSIITLRINDMMPEEFVNQIKELLAKKHYEEALNLCKQENNFCSSIIAAGIAARKHGPQVMIESMQSEGRRVGNSLWQRISLLNEIAVLAPMLGLLGTVLGLFFAFYDSNRTSESIAAIFDGLGIAVGTTVVGLIVALMAMLFYSTLKFRVINVLNVIENESLSLVNMIDLFSETKFNPPNR